ncbi:MAG TPA: DUF1439 domain-containing protein [Polaromonas sp.]|uniref:DUF1439 domain-containing protein n=1 Tax=Polaromonas sp. TaxID=1869339 RepID=UPI002D466464|nr:DUF1439 domain-containing protein [Polaromonas sp.]HYW55866.1 DUF1439 domain-containing protein [Polaromonas sp.]
MKRRQWITMLAGALALATTPAQAQPSYTVTTAQLQEAVVKKFPMRYPVGGLIELTLQPPNLRLLPEQNRLRTQMVVDANGPALSRSTTGNFDVDFALRYEPRDQSIRAHMLKVNSLSLSELAPVPAALLQAYGPSLAEQSLLEVELHKLEPKDLMLADGLGLEPGKITVTARGLVIGFVAKKVL